MDEKSIPATGLEMAEKAILAASLQMAAFARANGLYLVRLVYVADDGIEPKEQWLTMPAVPRAGDTVMPERGHKLVVLEVCHQIVSVGDVKTANVNVIVTDKPG